MIRPAWPTSFRARLTLRWTLAAGLLIGLANLGIYAAAHTYVYRWLDHNVRTIGATEAASSTDGSEGVHLHERAFEQLDAGAFTEKFVQIYDRDGRLVLASSALGANTAQVPASALDEAFAGRSPMLWLRALGRDARVVVLTETRDETAYAIAVGLFADDLQAGLASLAWLLLGVWLVSIAATAAIGASLAAQALSPVARITERAAWIAQGNFGARLDLPTAPDELGRMTQLLNSMLDRLQGALEANRRFAADASHELRGPLTAMAGELDVALRHPRSADSYADTLRHVRGRVSSLTTLTEDLILLVRSQEGSREVVLREVALTPLVGDAFARLSSLAAARGIRLLHNIPEGVHLYADPALISRVIDNVLANAVHYNRDGGEVCVAAHVLEPEGDAWATPLVVMTVADTGLGIPPGEQEQIFTRFHRLDQSRARHTGGSGLGLAICREVLGLLGGSIRVARSDSSGTTIEVRVPGVTLPVTAPV